MLGALVGLVVGSSVSRASLVARERASSDSNWRCEEFRLQRRSDVTGCTLNDRAANEVDGFVAGDG